VPLWAGIGEGPPLRTMFGPMSDQVGVIGAGASATAKPRRE
jgi:hypothetical protein